MHRSVLPLSYRSSAYRRKSVPYGRQLEADVTSASVDLMGNPVIRWMFRNVVIYRDANDNIKMDKRKSIEKIDGVVAMANAIGGYMSQDGDDMYQYNGVSFVNF